MVSNKRKRLSNNDQKDNISTVPDEILHHILSFLETVQVVQTCVLSKRWINVWKSHPSLNFNSLNYKNFLSITCSDYEPSRSNFNNFVNQVLARRNNFALLKVVEICFDCGSSRNINKDSLVGSLISYAVKHHVEEVVIDNYTYLLKVLPSCLLNCRSLRSLKLNNYRDLPKSVWSLPSLKTLHLDCVWESDGKFISSCPNLEYLMIGYITPLSEFKVHALKLKRLEILSWNARNILACKVMIFAPKLTHFYFGGDAPLVWSEVNLTSLDYVNVDVKYSSYEDVNLDLQLSLNLIKMLNEFQNATSLTLSLTAIKLLSKFPACLNEHPSPFMSLKYLKVEPGLKYVDSTRKRKRKRPGLKYVKIPVHVLNYFVSSSSTLEVCFYSYHRPRHKSAQL